MEEIFLIEPSKSYKDEFICMVQDYNIHKDEEYFNMYKNALENFDTYVETLLNNSKGIGLPEGWVACSNYWLVNTKKDVLGVIRIRKELNCDFLRTIGGHIGYDISPSNRKNGYGNLILRLGLEKAKNMKISPVLITCKSDNAASARVIERNRGVFESEIMENESKDIYRRYWVNLLED